MKSEKYIYDHTNLHSKYIDVYTEDYKVGDTVTWLGHDNVYGYMHGEKFTCTQKHYDLKEGQPVGKWVGKTDRYDGEIIKFPSHWIVRSNKVFDKLDIGKLPVLLLFVIVTNGIDYLYFDGVPYTFGGFGLLFIAWRLLVFRIKKKKKERYKDGRF